MDAMAYMVHSALVILLVSLYAVSLVEVKLTLVEEPS